MAYTSCVLDKHGYMHTRACTSPHTQTHSYMCNTYCFSTATMVSRTRLSVTLHVHCLSCLILNFTVNALSVTAYSFTALSIFKLDNLFKGNLSAKENKFSPMRFCYRQALLNNNAFAFPFLIVNAPFESVGTTVTVILSLSLPVTKRVTIFTAFNCIIVVFK